MDCCCLLLMICRILVLILLLVVNLSGQYIVGVCSFFRAFNAPYAILGCSSSEEIIRHMTRSFCLPILLYSLESVTLSKSILNSLEYCWTQVLHRIFKITSNVSFQYVSYFTNLLPIKYPIDLRKLRFWHTVHSPVLTGCSELVWSVLCKRTVKNLVTVYNVNITDSFGKYLSTVWCIFKNELNMHMLKLHILS